MGSSNETSHFGPVRNPWDAPRVPGGSSGGSAAAVAARMAPAATGTDTGGSIRQPAALTGVCGLKPTYGLVSRYGMIAFASSLDQGGPIAKSAADLALLLNVDGGLRCARFDQPRAARRGLRARARACRSRACASACRRSISARAWSRTCSRACARRSRWFESQGAQARVADRAAEHRRSRCRCTTCIAPAEASSNLSRFDGVRYGHRAKDYADLADMYCRTRAEGFGAEVKRRILIGTYVLSHGYYDAYYLQGAEGAAADREGFRRGVHALRPDHGADLAHDRVPARRQDRRPGADVPERHLHHPGAARRAAGTVDPLRLRRARACRSACRSWATTSPKRTCSASRTATSRRPTGTCACRREAPL